MELGGMLPRPGGISHFLFHSSVERLLGHFQDLAIMNNGAMSIVEQMSLQYECASFVYIPKE